MPDVSLPPVERLMCLSVCHNREFDLFWPSLRHLLCFCRSLMRIGRKCYFHMAEDNFLVYDRMASGRWDVPSYGLRTRVGVNGA
jgi:hypothetical protein